MLPVKMAIAYYVMYRVLPLISKKVNVIKRIIEFVFVFIAALFLYRLLLLHVVYDLILQEDGYQTGNFQNEFARSIYRALDILTVTGLAAILKLFRTRIQQAKREKQLIEEKLLSELHFLRAQIHPHFLFNTLNNIYVLARKKSDEAPEAVMQLSKILRFMLTECSKPKILLSNELQLIADYTTLEKLRYGARLHFTFLKEVDDAETEIAPLLLLPLVENAFKHGVSDVQNNPEINMRLQVSDNKLQFEIRNTKDSQVKTYETGIGLQNLKRQLELVYSDQKLTTEEESNFFVVKLYIHLNSFCETQVPDH